MKNIAKKGLLYALICLVVIAVCRVAITPSPAGEERRVLYTAGQIVDRIKKHVTCDWQKETVDTYIRRGTQIHLSLVLHARSWQLLTCSNVHPRPASVANVTM